MSSLTDTARVTRIAINFLIAGLITLIIGRVLWTVGLQIYKALNPPPPPPATLGFGVIPAPRFPVKDVPELNFQLETPDGTVPTFGPTARVFFIPEVRSNLLALERAKKQASSLGFVLEPEQVTNTIFRWTTTNPLSAVLEMDVNTSEFTVDVAWENDPNFLSERLLPNEERAIDEAKSYLDRAGLLPADMEAGDTKVTYLQYRGGKMSEAVSLSEADFLRVDLYRQKIGGLAVLPSDPNHGLARIIVSGSRGQGRRIVETEFKYYNVAYGEEYSNAETYPLISGPEAWEKLVNGGGYIASPPETGTEAVVRRVELALYDPLEPESFVQPIYLFVGDNGFVGYVPAIMEEWLK